MALHSIFRSRFNGHLYNPGDIEFQYLATANFHSRSQKKKFAGSRCQVRPKDKEEAQEPPTTQGKSPHPRPNGKRPDSAWEFPGRLSAGQERGDYIYAWDIPPLTYANIAQLEDFGEQGLGTAGRGPRKLRAEEQSREEGGMQAR